MIKERFVRWIDEKKYWEPALDADGDLRDDAWVIDASKVLELKDYPAGTRIYLRAEPLHPGAKANLFDTDGNRVTAFLTNAPRFNVAFLDARHRARGRCENRIKTLKSAGLGKLPYWSFAANQAWANLAMFALNLVSWVAVGRAAWWPRGVSVGCEAVAVPVVLDGGESRFWWSAAPVADSRESTRSAVAMPID